VLAILGETRPRMRASDVDGKQDRFKVIFGKAGRPCPRCAADGVVSLIRVRGQGDDNRRTFWCERCQH
jgi:endonuclease-8